MLLFVAPLIMTAPRAARADDAPTTESEELEAKRERFRAGMERYRAREFSEALDIWNPIYLELGPREGYRLAFNIARAYQQLAASRSGSEAALSATAKALDHYAAYVTETTRRRAASEVLEPLVVSQEEEAKAHLGRLALVGDPRTPVTLDDETRERHASTTVWIAPGRHVVTFSAGTRAERATSITVEPGNVSELVVPPVPVEPSPAAVRFERRPVPPFRQNVLYVAAGVSALTIVVPLILRQNALAIRDDYEATTNVNERARLDRDYASASSIYYASWAIPSVAFAATLGLTAYWILATNDKRLPVSLAVTPTGATVHGRF